MAFKLAKTALRRSSSKQLEASSALLGRLPCVQGLPHTVRRAKSNCTVLEKHFVRCLSSHVDSQGHYEL